MGSVISEMPKRMVTVSIANHQWLISISKDVRTILLLHSDATRIIEKAQSDFNICLAVYAA